MKDGTRIQEIADGTVISTAPDGTKTQVRVSSVREGGGARMRVWLGLRTILLEGGRCVDVKQNVGCAMGVVRWV